MFQVMIVCWLTHWAGHICKIVTKARQKKRPKLSNGCFLINLSRETECGTGCNTERQKAADPDQHHPEIGWAQNKKDVRVEIMPYFSIQYELSTQDGLVFRGERIDSPQEHITHWIHLSHLGNEGCLMTARECIYWSGRNEYTRILLQNVTHVDAKKQKETLQPQEIANRLG